MIITLLLCYLFLGDVHADTGFLQENLQNKPLKSVEENDDFKIEEISSTNDFEEINRQLEKKHQEVKNDLARLINGLESIKDSGESTESSILKSTEQITQLFQKQSTENIEEKGISFEVWAGVLLACVAVIVTGLGVVIALLALWGYNNIKRAAVEEAVKKSEVLVREAIESGEFNELIYIAVNRAIYRGIMSENDFPDPGSEGEVNELQ